MNRSKKVARPHQKAGMTKSKAMSIYRARVAKHQRVQAPPVISQVNVVIGTDNTWSNAQAIDRNPAWVPVNNARYVWSARNLSDNNAIISRRFQLSTRRSIIRGRLFLSVDNYAVVIINGFIVQFDSPQETTSFFNPGRTFNITRFLRRGTNDIVIIAFNSNGAPRSDSNPAGVAARLNIRLSSL
ncbi:hypothetical protein [Paenibacillus flagellatus]|uniref:Glycosyl hydrolases family 2 sugar binding domain-containing protein n=1 Tax=Paenibacillus flagellatus TaxID=2211139 RepID=A0A2V5K6D2_9BACL|nr:hypothetical protein [Paenibacillus flagellatus]PYI53313.1 hypothetical protein DLM86_16125 [Paenibacillus flagellatus]